MGMPDLTGSVCRWRGLTLGLFLWATCLSQCQGSKYLIGQESNSGAFEIHFSEDKHDLDLRKDCHDSRPCPPVVIMTGRMVGTVDVKNCQDGVMYTFVNKGELDAGVVLQHSGGLYGSKGIAQFGVGTCFCYTGGALMCG
mmetsp:Transcript_22737/g.53053  ORF Transcript_22737/g.53053 Transcript_22737/m.53053 type:complete len:140 (-) Transcript_22737:94-513(-)